MREDTSQLLLILSGVLVASLFGAFLYREMFPEYKIYQEDYQQLEAFRSTYTHEPLPPFQFGIKQIVIEREDKGPAIIDRCTSCHVALEIPYFSPTTIAKDEDGKAMVDAHGKHLLIPNEDYIWKKLDEKIGELRDEKVLSHLRTQGENEEAKKRLALAANYESLKTARVGHNTYDVKKVLAMHPLIGNELYPFQYHPLEEYGCTSCHSGNGRALTTTKAHGPVFDDQYEPEHTGHTPRFIESDPHNDPRFARVFNHKPGEELIFQTDPILVGALIQSRCVQCHDPSTGSQNQEQLSLKDQESQSSPAFSLISPSLRDMTKDYQRGKELYISQACYACHRIAPFSRGGVGPELTRIGNEYPWYIKRKLMWPQGDLPTSTMPNMRFDHQELEDLMTFLFAQKGRNQTVSKTSYQSQLKAWEGGKKMEWEKPIAPTQIENVQEGMIIFATEGCAACHRLQGFDSQVGFASEKDRVPEQQYADQQWFKKLFPEVVHLTKYDEELPGNEIVKLVEQHAQDIDARIISHAHPKGILDLIQTRYPDLIESFYSPFRHASRAKNHAYDSLIAQEQDPAQIERLQKEKLAWKERIHRVLMMYIQTYGLGRLIGPHLNWSGIYRTDEWLMEHFRKPSQFIPRSIMPVFPFDDTKFYALTHMLNVLAIQNRNALRETWDQHGFDPQETYNMLCAQCHGIGRVGNGAIAEWIYPIPKNLRNPDFLRNLTKEQIIESITYGVHGTPMPPWGEIAANKPEKIQVLSKGLPVLQTAEIRYLVEWLFSGLPGGTIIRETTDVPKWQYQPEDILKELQNEGSQLKSETHSSLFPRLKDVYYASLNPHLYPNIEEKDQTPKNVEDIFDIVPNPMDPNDPSYFIKRKYYTVENIEKGKEFFLINCATCHGNDADGSGVRGLVMDEAKPRMLTNLAWIDSRDDLRLLRSIKFGVPGTSMTPWGDLTNSLQRIQLVIFIRSLSEEHEKRRKLTQTLYETFENGYLAIEHARVEEHKKMEELIAQQQWIKDQMQTLAYVPSSETSDQKRVELYRTHLQLEKEIAILQKQDQALLSLKESLKKEYDIYWNLGIAILNQEKEGEWIQIYLDIIRLNQAHYLMKEGQLSIQRVKGYQEQIHKKKEEIFQKIDAQIGELQKEEDLLKGKIGSSETKENLNLVQAKLKALNNLKTKLTDDIQKAFELANSRN